MRSYRPWIPVYRGARAGLARPGCRARGTRSNGGVSAPGAGKPHRAGEPCESARNSGVSAPGAGEPRGAGRNGGVSAPAAGEPRDALNPGMRIALRYDRRWLRRRSGHLGRRHADADDNPFPVTFAGHPTRTRIRGSHPLNFSRCLDTIHESQDSAVTRARPCGKLPSPREGPERRWTRNETPRADCRRGSSIISAACVSSGSFSGFPCCSGPSITSRVVRR